MKTAKRVLIEFDDMTMDLHGAEAEAWWESHKGAMGLVAAHSPGSMTPGFDSHGKFEVKTYTDGKGGWMDNETRTYTVNGKRS